MRIIAGKFRGRLLRVPAGKSTRPMLDRVREAMFSTLGDRWNDARVLDLFAGTGSLALEALSRGASSALLVERDRATVQLLLSNVEDLGVADLVDVRSSDALQPASWGVAEDRSGFGVVFFDPPYPLLDDPMVRPRVLAALQRLVSGALLPEGVLVFHAPRGKLCARDVGAEPSTQASRPWSHADLREYGSNALWYLRARSEATCEPKALP